MPTPKELISAVSHCAMSYAQTQDKHASRRLSEAENALVAEMVRLRTALERLQRLDFEYRRDGLGGLPDAVVKTIDDALAA